MLPENNSGGLLKAMKRDQLGYRGMLPCREQQRRVLKAIKRVQLGYRRMLPENNSGRLLKTLKREQLGSNWSHQQRRAFVCPEERAARLQLEAISHQQLRDSEGPEVLKRKYLGCL